MKFFKLFASILVFSLSLTFFSGCGDGAGAVETDGLNVVATIFPAYDFSRQCAGELANVTMLLPPGSESHSYEPSAKDIVMIENCDLFVYNGGESDEWIEKLLGSMDHEINTLKMIDCVTLVEEETVEGMENGEESTDESDDAEYDEHVWTSPKNAAAIVGMIGDKLAEIDPDNAEAYESNAGGYIEQIVRLDGDFREFFDGLQNKLLIFGDRFPLRYFVEEYGLTYYAAFPGCSSETEPSAATVAFLIDKVKSENARVVFHIELSNCKTAESIAETCGVETALFHTCHNISRDDFDSGATYVSLMRQNLATLREYMD